MQLGWGVTIGVTQGAFPFLLGFNKIICYMVGTFNCEFTLFVPNPNDFVFWKIMAQRNFPDCIGFEGQEGCTK